MWPTSAPGFGWSSIAIGKAYSESTVDGFDIDVPSIETDLWRFYRLL